MYVVISVDLDGFEFSVDDAAYFALRSYLNRARERLGGHPDRDEVIAGLERSIAAKLGSRRAAQDAVIDHVVMATALKEVGRVDGPSLDGGAASRSKDQDRSGPRRLYRLREGHRVAGVCAGLAVYAGIDPGIVRLLFIVGAIFSGGIVLLAYIVLALLMPIAPSELEPEEPRGARRS